MKLQKKKHIVIIGAGFAGLRLARILNNHRSYRITLIDKNNYHQFQPLLYQVATANLGDNNIAFPIRTIFRKSKNISIQITEVEVIYASENKIRTTTGIIGYDYLVIATGAETNYFGYRNMQEHAFPMKSTIEALQLKSQLIKNLEEASVATDEELLKKLLTVVIVGAGPTGIELSGALADMRLESLPMEYPEIDFKKMKIYLLEGNDRILAGMSSVSSLRSKEYLEELDVLVRTNTLVKDYDGEKVLLSDGSLISSALVIWTAGVKGNFSKGLSGQIITKDNRIKVDNFNNVLDHKNVFALGDIAFMETPNYPKGHPQLASVAIDQATNLARNFKRVADGKIVHAYNYNNKGTMATIGRNKAVVDLAKPHVSFQGFLAWILWMTIHLFLLIGFKNRLVVFINWAYQYFMHTQSFSLLYPPLLRKKSGIKIKQEIPELANH